MKDRIIRSAYLHPVVFAIYPILFLFSSNMNILSLVDILRPLILVTGGAIILFLILKLILGDDHRSSGLVSVFLIFFFSYGHIRFLLPDLRWHIGSFVLYPNTVLIPLWGAVLLIVAFLIFRMRNKQANLSYFLNVSGIILICVSLITILPSVLGGSNNTEDSKPLDINEGITQKPDIYYIILDGYGGNDILKERFGFDNETFTEALASKGFDVLTNGRSNYCQTILSLYSSLNFSYLAETTTAIGKNSSDRRTLIDQIKNSELRSFLSNYGYTTVAYSSGYYGTEINNADVFITPPGWLNEFEEILLNTTPLPIVVRKLKSDEQHRRRILFNLDHLNMKNEIESPKFVFAHFICPHPPFIFESDGRVIPSGGVQILAQGKDGIWPANEDDEQKYIQQLQFMNSRILTIVDSIKSNSRIDPVIVIQGDHGSLFPRDKITDSLFYKEKFSILNALYIPYANVDSISENHTPVNTFRIILNSYFQAGYEILPNRSYFSEWGTPYELEDVSDRIK